MSKGWSSQLSVTLHLNPGSSKSKDVESIVTTNLFTDTCGFLSNLGDKGAQHVEDNMRQKLPWMHPVVTNKRINGGEEELNIVLECW